MNKILSIVVIAALAIFSLFSCASGAQAASKSAANPYTGDGGKGVSLTVLVPKGSGLAADQNYLPELVQGEFVSNISGYSAISVLDRVNLDKIIAETLDPTYQDNLDIVRLGHVMQTAYIMTGTVTKTASGYNLQAQIGATADGITKASYSGTCTFAELDNLTGIRRASLELLGKMGVALTEQAKKELSGAAAANQVNAQTSLARGIVAQRSGNVAETLGRFYEANSYDPSLAEAASRASAVSKKVRAGNLGESLKGLRNDMAWRAEWKKTLEDAAAFLENQRFVVAEVSYKDLGLKVKPDYKKGTMEFTYNPNIWVKPMPYPPAYLKLIADLNKGLQATGRNKDWGLERLYAENIIFISSSSGRGDLETSFGKVDITVSLINSKGQVLGFNDFNGIGTYYGIFLGSNAQGIYIYHPIEGFFGPVVAAKPGVKLSIGRLIKEHNLNFTYQMPNGFSIQADSKQADDITDEMSLEVTAAFSDYNGAPYLIRVIQE